MVVLSAKRIAAVMGDRGYHLDRGAGEINIVYIEGADGREPDKWNDLRLVLTFFEGEPYILSQWQATTEPGRFYTDHPLSSMGAARIALGQFQAWRVGYHHANKPTRHEALVQRAPITVYRDVNHDCRRTGDPTQTGDYFGINQHWGYDISQASIGRASAGCLVGRTKEGHRNFISLIKGSAQYRADPETLFRTTILDASWISSPSS